MSTPETTYVNHTATKAGTVRAVCECCGKQSRPAKPETDGEPSLWSLPVGWSVAAFPADCVHSDGSFGSFYKCPACEKKLKAGQSLKVRDYPPPRAIELNSYKPHLKVLSLTLKKYWFDMIASGEKKEEYREIKQYWNRRLSNKRFDTILFRNGYNPGSPTLLVELRDHLVGFGVAEWGAPEDEAVHILRLGRILQAPPPPVAQQSSRWLELL